MTLNDRLQEALATPTDSKQILAEWLDSVLGEPITKVIHVDEGGLDHIIYLTKPLFKKPEVL